MWQSEGHAILARKGVWCQVRPDRPGTPYPSPTATSDFSLPAAHPSPPCSWKEHGRSENPVHTFHRNGG